ncbi:endoplasmic reticulum protein-like protein [Patellaria atrata CBS 101060]|uniref:Endoplasmic reticulum transmembrane protein n=1 Tax=Patellaria atrata CBS 101060 TaxID=1346257 RepID=A0A9P4SBG5_9PEZI|nr:endoplasmic reticulum protein-like protein [Patellaria atrata CBS 101060]
MTLYYSLVFAMLVTEMAIFMSLIVPLPFTWRRKLFNFISENPLIAKLQYGMKICFIFILILFIDSVNRVYRVQIEVAAASKDNRGSTEVLGGSARMEVQARKFYSQRNMYLCGFTLFLSLILNRTYVMILDVLRLEEENKSLKGDSSAKGTDAAKLGAAGKAGEVGKLKKLLEEKDRDIATLKKQTEGLQREYNRMGDTQAMPDSTPKKSR